MRRMLIDDDQPIYCFGDDVGLVQLRPRRAQRVERVIRHRPASRLRRARQRGEHRLRQERHVPHRLKRTLRRFMKRTPRLRALIGIAQAD